MKISTLLVLWGALLLPAFAQATISMNQYIRYQPSKVGCWLPLNGKHKFDCTEQLLHYEILKRLNKSQTKGSLDHLSKMVLERAKFFMQKGMTDYQSVISIMVFPIQGKQEWLKLFANLKSEKSEKFPYAKIALKRVQGKKSQFCDGQKGTKHFSQFLKEICTLKIL